MAGLRARWAPQCALQLTVLAAVAALGSLPSAGQGLQTVLEARRQVLPSLGAGVTVLKRDAAGRYYVLGKAASVISIYNGDGSPAGHIPNANSRNASIGYAVDFDLSDDGRLFVADRGANAVEIFKLDGTLEARVLVTAPTSVVALSNGQFAVTSLTSKRLIEIKNEEGRLVRTFGDPADAGEDAANKPMVDWGRISGDTHGDIFFGFSSLAQPTVRRYDSYGYVAYEAVASEKLLASEPTRGDSRVEVRFNLTHMSLSEQSGGSVTVGSSGDVKFNAGVGSGLLSGFRGGGGSRGAFMQQNQEGLANGTAAGGFGGALAGTVSGEISDQGPQFKFGLGKLPGLGGRGRRAAANTTDGTGTDEENSGPSGSVGPQAQLLQFYNSGNASGTDFTAGDLNEDLAFNSNSSDDEESALAPDLNSQPVDGDYANPALQSPFGLPNAFVFGSLWNGGRFGPENFGRAGGGFGGERPHAGGAEGFHNNDFQHFGPRGRFGGQTGLSASLRVNLGNLGNRAPEHAQITAVGVDPETREIWAAMDDVLVHFDANGNPVGVFRLTMTGGAPLKASAILVEHDRLLVVSSAWGVFEFARTPSN